MKLLIDVIILLLLQQMRPSHALCPELCNCPTTSKLRCNNILTTDYIKNMIIPDTMKEIHFTNNKIAKISAEILRPFRHVTKLVITRNLIDDIPENTFREFENLTTLDLTANVVRELHPDSFAGLSKLTSLNLGRNKLTYLYEGMFEHVPLLRTLKLMRNKISSIPNGVFTRVTTLKDLFIGYNQIVRLGDRAFQNMSMYKLDISHNLIERIERSVFMNFNVRYKIILMNNKLACTCRDVMVYAKDFKALSNDIWAFCHSPENLKGKSILKAFTQTDCTLCDLDLCQNGGTCRGNKTTFNCLCPDQFKGKTCETSICKPEIRYIEKIVQLPSVTVLKYRDTEGQEENEDEKPDPTQSAMLEKKNKELETKLMILYAICSLELVIILCFVGLLIMGKYQDWRLMKQYRKQKSPHVLAKFRNNVDEEAGKGYISISELIPYKY